MPDLPSQSTPLNQHSLRALEQWLASLGASRVDGDPCLWAVVTPEWTAELQLEREDLRVAWQRPDQSDRVCSLPYGLPRADVEAAILAGP